MPGIICYSHSDLATDLHFLVCGRNGIPSVIEVL